MKSIHYNLQLQYFFFLLNGKYHFRNELLKLTICDKQTIRPIKTYFHGKKKDKNMEAESIELETVLLWSEQDIKYRYKFVVTEQKI